MPEKLYSAAYARGVSWHLNMKKKLSIFVRFIVSFGILVFLSTCSLTTHNPEAVIYRAHSHKYVFVIETRTKGRGNFHALNCSKYDYTTSNWVYIDTLVGRVAVDTLYYNYIAAYPASGSIILTPDSAIVNIIGLPSFDGKTDTRQGIYEFNGKYRLRFDSSFIGNKLFRTIDNTK